jgi:hypothetical protein
MTPFPRYFLATVLAVVGLLGSVAPQPAEGASLDGGEQDLVARVNAFRAARSLPTLAVSDTLTAAAKWMSADMGAGDYFSHTSLDGRSPTQRMADAGYPAFTTWTGEDLAAGYTSAADVLNGWINSPAHYAVLVNPRYNAIGVAHSYGAGSTYGWYWAADFGGVIDGGRAAPIARAPTVSAPLAGTAVAPAAARPDLGFHARWNAQSADPDVAPGELATLVVALENTGYRGWYSGVADEQVNLGTNDPQDAELPELAVDWLSANRPTTTTTAYVAPGAVGWFSFTVRAPAAAGDLRLGLRPVVDGLSWLEDDGIFFMIHVRAPVSVRRGLSFFQ